MEKDILKGNFKVKNAVVVNEEKSAGSTVSKELKKKTLASLGGSMVYMERTDLTWDGDK